MFSFILFRRNINYLLPRLLNFWKSDILPRTINCCDVHADIPQHQYLASYVYIITGVITISLFLLATGTVLCKAAITEEYGFRPVGPAVGIGGHDLNAYGGVKA